MGFIEREKECINELLRNTPNDHEASASLQAAQQALSWALEPNAFASPSATIHKWFGIGSEGTQGTGTMIDDLPPRSTAAGGDPTEPRQD